DLRCERGGGGLAAGEEVPASWELADGDLRFELRPTPTGQVGLFPEQASNRAWVRDVVASSGSGVIVLNLFAYTGAITLSAAAAGAALTHVDGARPAIGWARRNAAPSAPDDRPGPLIVG